MKRVIADTNIFLRFLTNDIPQQAEIVQAYFLKAQKGHVRITILHITVLELVFQLERYYKLARKEAVEKVILILSPEWIEVESKGVIIQVLKQYSSSSIDFVDLMTFHFAKSKNIQVFSFDHDFESIEKDIRIKI